MNQIFAVLLGAIITVIFSGILLESYKRHRDLQGTASAIAGEVYSIIHMSERRQTAAHFAMLLTRLERGEKVDFPNIMGGDPSIIDPVIEKHLDRIGLLPHNLPERIATFYTYMRGIRIDIVNLAKAQFPDPKIQAGIVRADLVLWADAVQLGNGLWTDLRALAAKVWWLQASVLQLKTSCMDWTRRGLKAVTTYVQKHTRPTAGVLPSKTGVQASVVVTQPMLAENLAPSVASSFEPHYHQLVSEVEAKINTELPALAAKLGKNQEDALRYVATDQYSGLLLERASRFLYGSQIDAVIFLNSNNYRATMDEIRGFYETGAANYPQMYVNYTLEKWLGFLILNGIVRVSDNIVGATSIAKALIPYMRMRGYLVTKAAG